MDARKMAVFYMVLVVVSVFIVYGCAEIGYMASPPKNFMGKDSLNL